MDEKCMGILHRRGTSGLEGLVLVNANSGIRRPEGRGGIGGVPAACATRRRHFSRSASGIVRHRAASRRKTARSSGGISASLWNPAMHRSRWSGGRFAKRRSAASVSAPSRWARCASKRSRSSGASWKKRLKTSAFAALWAGSIAFHFVQGSSIPFVGTGGAFRRPPSDRTRRVSSTSFCAPAGRPSQAVRRSTRSGLKSAGARSSSRWRPAAVAFRMGARKNSISAVRRRTSRSSGPSARNSSSFF
jgi:hypothetical protein